MGRKVGRKGKREKGKRVFLFFLRSEYTEDWFRIANSYMIISSLKADMGVQSILRYRGFIWGSIRRDIQLRYRGSILGKLWALLNPLALIFVYTIIFSGIMGARLPGVQDSMAYGIYLCSGLLTWSYFVEVLTRSQNMFLDQAGLLKKASFPRSTLPVIISGIAMVNFTIVFAIFLGFLLITGRFPGIVLVSFLPILALQQLLAVGIGLIVGTLNVFFRDVGQAMGIILQFWFWLTPIVYPVSILPDEYKFVVINFNPISRFVMAYQDIFLLNTNPDWGGFLPQLILSIICLAIGYLLFVKLEGEMLDEL